MIEMETHKVGIHVMIKEIQTLFGILGFILVLMTGIDLLFVFMIMMVETMMHCPVGTHITPSLDATITTKSVGIMAVVAMCTSTIVIPKSHFIDYYVCLELYSIIVSSIIHV